LTGCEPFTLGSAQPRTPLKFEEPASAVTAAVIPYADLLNSFGLAEPRAVSADGTLQIKSWQHTAQQRLREWASARGVAADD
jgi:hypothetical protein